jgi:ethanolamine ammonia-lyase small subunit
MSRILHRAPSSLRELTPARVALTAAGHSIATEEVLAFQLAHARARDAVHARLDAPAFALRLSAELARMGAQSIRVLELRSNAADRATYLRNPEMGRTLDPDSAAQLIRGSFDLALVIADGLSALAVERNAIPLTAALLPLLLSEGWSIAPIAVVDQGRVAIADPIGESVGARCSLVLIGERPGLSSPDSLGAYLTWAPRPGRTDAERNCLSNIHSGGLDSDTAAARLHWLLRAARTRQLSGIALKEGLLELNGEGTRLKRTDDHHLR